MITPQCSKCNETSRYNKIKRGNSTRYYMNAKRVMIGKICAPCTLKKQRADRVLNNNKTTLKYEKTQHGFIMRAYRNMLSRVTGVQRKKCHLYFGKEILSKEVFYLWSLSSRSFKTLFKNWESSGYERRLCPSVDRIDSSQGYYLENIRWLVFHRNCSAGAISKRDKHRSELRDQAASS